MHSLFTIAIVTLLEVRCTSASPDATWEELQPMPEGRSGMVAFTTINSEPAYYGGTSWHENSKRTHSSGYSFENGQWHPLDILEEPIAYAAVASENSLAYAAGGTNGSKLLPHLLILNTTLERSTAEIPSSHAKIYAGATFVDGTFYQIGGSSTLSLIAPSATVSKFEQDAWVDISQLPEGSLINPAVSKWRGRIIVIGGGMPSSKGLKNTDSIFSFEPTKRAWEKLAELPAPIRGSLAHCVPNTGIIIIGGCLNSGEITSQILLFDPDKRVFVSLADLPTALMLPAVVANKEYIYVFGGEDAPRHRSNRVHRARLSDLLQRSPK